MSEIDVKSVATLYDNNVVAQVILDCFADQPHQGNKIPPTQIRYVADVVSKSKVSLSHNRKDVIQVFQKLEFYGAGKLGDDGKGKTEFQWTVSPVLLARVATGELEHLPVG